VDLGERLRFRGGTDVKCISTTVCSSGLDMSVETKARRQEESRTQAPREAFYRCFVRVRFVYGREDAWGEKRGRGTKDGNGMNGSRSKSEAHACKVSQKGAISDGKKKNAAVERSPRRQHNHFWGGRQKLVEQKIESCHEKNLGVR